MKTTNIYGLYDPRRPRVVMYVGKGLSYRAKKHWNQFLTQKRAVNRRLFEWFKELKKDKIKPEWRILETVPITKWKSSERKWIKFWKKRNPKLYNVAPGGNSPKLNACSLGGKRANQLNPGLAKRAGNIGGSRTHKLHPRLYQKLGKELGLKHGSKGAKRANKVNVVARRRWGKELGLKFGRKGGKKGGLKGGGVAFKRIWKTNPRKMKKFASNGGRRVWELHPKLMKEVARKAGKLGGSIGGQTGCHNRWHIKKGIVNTKCRLCRRGIK